jgi:hypothetical protein
MSTLKKLKEERMSIISKLIKKEKDKNSSPVSPQFIKDFKDKILLENSALKLSINDYKLMCSKDKVLNMMSIALNKPKDKLKKFCKYISVFEKNISKSPESIANIINNPITILPQDLRSIILDKFFEMLPTKYVLLDWIDQKKLNWFILSKNPNAIDLLESNPDNINWNILSNNPNAIDLLEKRIEYEKFLNPVDYKNLKSNKKIDWSFLSQNPNAINLLKENQDNINWYCLAKNPNAIDLLKERIKYENELNITEYNKLKTNKQINWLLLSENPNAIDLLKERIKYENSLNDKDYSYLRRYQQINWDLLSKNPNAINLLKERIKYEKSNLEKNNSLKSHQKIDWSFLSQNPNAITILKKYPDDIIWNDLSANPNAIDLIIKKVEDENKLSPEEYNKLPVNKKINWTLLSENLNLHAIDLLENNPDKIDWDLLSKNPNAINLLEKRIKYENELNITKYNKLPFNKKINWENLSKNQNAINLLQNVLKNNKNNNKINWIILSGNPNAIDLLEKKAEYEKELNITEYYNLPFNKKIDWTILAENPSIFKPEIK